MSLVRHSLTLHHRVWRLPQELRGTVQGLVQGGLWDTGSTLQGRITKYGSVLVDSPPAAWSFFFLKTWPHSRPPPLLPLCPWPGRRCRSLGRYAGLPEEKRKCMIQLHRFQKCWSQTLRNTILSSESGVRPGLPLTIAVLVFTTPKKTWIEMLQYNYDKTCLC